MTKVEIRKTYLNLRVSLTEEENIKRNHQLCDFFFSSIDLSTVRVIHIFLPILAKKEPDTWLIIDRLQKRFEKIRISIPKIENNQITSYYFQEREQLKLNSWGIYEPAFGDITPSEEIDLVIVPLLAFDEKGNRVGYGKGFYDRFLKTCRSDCKKIGLSFFEAVTNLLPIDKHDIALDAVITPSGLKSFSSF